MPIELKSEPGYVLGLSALILADCKADLTAENLVAVAEASGNKVPAAYASMVADLLEKAGGVDKFCPAPGSGGGGGGGGKAPAAAAAAPAAVAEKPKVEEVDALEGGMDMFGGGGGGGGDY